MRVYFSGIGGVGIGPLARIARDAGYDVVGSDSSESLTTRELSLAGISIMIGDQDGSFLRQEHNKSPIDYFVYTAALSQDHPEIVAAKDLGIMCLKRDGMIARIVSEKNLKMIACAGTHGKTSTTGLLVWVLKQLGIPVSYSIGTTLNYGPSGAYSPDSLYFVYECDEYDRNFLHYTPRLSIISSVDYDHTDTYATLQDYAEAFRAFIDQSDKTYLWLKDAEYLGIETSSGDGVTILNEEMSLDHLHLAGYHMRQNAFLVERSVMKLFPTTNYHDLIEAINSFPGTDRRMEKLAEGLYTDYGHHPTEIKATLEAARELAESVVLVYQPHQNTRQHQIKDDYTNDIFSDAKKVYWLPTYQSREDPALDILTPEELTKKVQKDKLGYADLNDDLWREIEDHLKNQHLVLCMGAGSIDGWLREKSGSAEASRED